VTLLEAALEYAGRGWPVLPLKPRDKVPDGALVPHGLKESSTDQATLEGWWEASPAANIGLRTGVAFDALDVDTDGWKSLACLVDENGCLPSGPVVMTANGAHYWFKVTGQGNRARFRPGLDWRGQAGYVLAPPSVHPSGSLYEWAIPPDEAELVAAPAWLVEQLTRRPAPPTQPSRQVDTSAYGRRAIEGEAGKVTLASVGERNAKLNEAAFALGQLVGSGVLDVDDVIAALLTAAARCGLNDETEVRRTIASGLRAGLARPRRVSS
jgi:hypothetical protein